jgi:hypothetical protein
MKKVFSSIMGVLMLGSISAQKVQTSEVPANILTAFHNAYLNAENAQWEMDYDSYEVKFKNNRVEMAATYNKDGKWLKTETAVNRSTMPAAVKESLAKEFESYEVNEIEKIDKPNGVSYLIDLDYKQVNYVITISEKGEVLSKDEAKDYKKD